MWAKGYFFAGLLLLALFGYAQSRGWILWHSIQNGSWHPHGHAYHK